MKPKTPSEEFQEEEEVFKELVLRYMDAVDQHYKTISSNTFRTDDIERAQQHIKNADAKRREAHDEAARMALAQGLVPSELPVPGKPDATLEERIEEGWRNARKFIAQISESMRFEWERRRGRKWRASGD